MEQFFVLLRRYVAFARFDYPLDFILHKVRRNVVWLGVFFDRPGFDAEIVR